MEWWATFRTWPRWAQALAWLGAFPAVLLVFTLSRPAEMRRPWWLVTVCSAAAWAALAATAPGDREPDDVAGPRSSPERAGPPTTERLAAEGGTAPEGGHRSGRAETVSSAEPGGVMRTPGSDALLEVLAALRVEPEHARDGYERGLFPQWDDVDGDGCDTRCEVLSAQRRADGTWLSEWDGYVTDDSRELHVDHVVALAEAWDSGAHRWSAARRDEFADWEPNLLAVSAAMNVAKGDDDAASWFPARAEANCLWASIVVQVKARWDLSVDAAERDALGNLLRTCADHRPAATTTPPRPTPLLTPSPPRTAAARPRRRLPMLRSACRRSRSAPPPGSSPCRSTRPGSTGCGSTAPPPASCASPSTRRG